MKAHPEYLASFRGAPTTIHPENKAWHDQYVTRQTPIVNGLIVAGLTDVTYVTYVLKIPGSEFWYHPVDFFRLYGVYLARKYKEALK